MLDLEASVLDLAGFHFMTNLVSKRDKTNTSESCSSQIDRSEIPRGILEDVLVKVEDCYFPVDFVILDMEGADSIQHDTLLFFIALS